MKKLIALTLSLVMILTLFCGCGVTKAGEKSVGILMPTKEFPGVKALDKVSFQVKKGEIKALSAKTAQANLP